MEIRNRIEFPAMGTKMVKDEKVVTDQLINYHAARSLGGNGLNFTEVCSVYDKAAPKNFLALSDDKYIPGMKSLLMQYMKVEQRQEYNYGLAVQLYYLEIKLQW